MGDCRKRHRRWSAEPEPIFVVSAAVAATIAYRKERAVSRIYVTTYEVIGDGLPIAAKFYGEVEAARAEHWRYAESVGGSGIRPGHDGGIRSVFFASDLPVGWRRIGREGGKTEAVPNRGTKSGKAALAAMQALPRTPTAHELASRLGYSPSEMAMDPERGTIFFPTEMRVAHPTERTFVRLPRFSGDGFEPDEKMLNCIPESTLMKAVEDHNAEARRLRELEAA